MCGVVCLASICAVGRQHQWPPDKPLQQSAGAHTIQLFNALFIFLSSLVSGKTSANGHAWKTKSPWVLLNWLGIQLFIDTDGPCVIPVNEKCHSLADISENRKAWEDIQVATLVYITELLLRGCVSSLPWALVWWGDPMQKTPGRWPPQHGKHWAHRFPEARWRQRHRHAVSWQVTTILACLKVPVDGNTLTNRVLLRHLF